ncbi:ParA family protein [Fulvimarina sp. 2208YS6-2-32]|uniref:ParA family protein n=1 Tax=Fulvimarina uroteuthidis TaxID=3098149 RepID=A0ABU5I728_9HYPH|nr:ParA family protein [Fulvimarina sp. 2208YS6-2-32]MDY8111172.1 ParA family protein [Fulvimarina sp. 2208YS6-2-32]
MKVIAIASRKGGSSKTTLAVHIAGLAGAIILDADPQGSAGEWYGEREAETPLVIEVRPGELVELVEQARAENAPVIIDTPPHAEASIAEAMRVSDLVLIPVRPSLFDLRAAGATFDMAKALKVPAAVILTQCPASSIIGEPSIVKEARQYLASIDAPVLKATMGSRAAYQHALISGSSADEYEPAGKAAKEIAALWKEIRKHLA